jgi:hypothetical protein
MILESWPNSRNIDCVTRFEDQFSKKFVQEDISKERNNFKKLIKQ